MNADRPILREELDRAIEIIADLVARDCTVDGGLDSMASSSYAEAMRFLRDHGKVKFEDAYGDRILAHWMKP
jgi:aryl carrier-like protein